MTKRFPPRPPDEPPLSTEALEELKPKELAEIFRQRRDELNTLFRFAERQGYQVVFDHDHSDCTHQKHRCKIEIRLWEKLL